MTLLLQANITSQVLNDNQGVNIVSQLLLPIFYFILICVLAYFTTKWLASSKGIKGRGFNKSSKLSVSDTLYVGYQKNIQLVKVGQRFFLLAVTKDDIRFLSEVSKEDLNEDIEKNLLSEESSDLSESNPDNKLFDKYLKQFISKNKEHR